MRTHRLVLCLIAIVSVSVSGFSRIAAGQENPKTREPGGAITVGEVRTATVKAIDADKRTITLQKSDGDTIEIKCGQEVRNFDQIKVGDQVKAAAVAQLVVSLAKGTNASEGEGTVITRSPKGGRPGAVIARTEQDVAKITAIDADKQTVTLSGLGDKPETVRVAQDVDLSTVKIGDEVVVRITKGIALWVASPSDAQTAAETIKPDGYELSDFALEGATRSATVTAIDPAARLVTLQGEQGNTRTIHLGKECVNFDQIKVGDKVHATLADEVAVSVSKGGVAPGADADSIVSLAPQGAKPGILIIDSDVVTGQIKSIDADKKMITLAMPDGSTKMIKVSPSVKLSELKEGDDVSARVTQAMAIVVEKPQQ